jgi:hypothetical protein
VGDSGPMGRTCGNQRLTDLCVGQRRKARTLHPSCDTVIGTQRQPFKCKTCALITVSCAIQSRDLALQTHMHGDGPVFAARSVPTAFFRLFGWHALSRQLRCSREALTTANADSLFCVLSHSMFITFEARPSLIEALRGAPGTSRAGSTVTTFRAGVGT